METRSFTAFVEFDPETRLYVGTIPSVPGAHSQGQTLDELQANLKEVLELCLEDWVAQGVPIVEDDFVGIQKIAVTL